MKKNQNRWIVFATVISLGLSAAACARRPAKPADKAAEGATKTDNKAGDANKLLSKEDCTKQRETVSATIEKERPAVSAKEVSADDKAHTAALANELRDKLNADTEFAEQSKQLITYLGSKSKNEKDKEEAEKSRKAIDTKLLALLKEAAPSAFGEDAACDRVADTTTTVGRSIFLRCELRAKSKTDAEAAPEAKTESKEVADANAQSGSFEAGADAKATERLTSPPIKKESEAASIAARRWVDVHFRTDVGMLGIRLYERTDHVVELNGKKLTLLAVHLETRRFDSSDGKVIDSAVEFPVLKMPADENNANPKPFHLAAQKGGEGDATEELLKFALNPECSATTRDTAPGSIKKDTKTDAAPAAEPGQKP